MLVTHTDKKLLRRQGGRLSDYHLTNNSTVMICMRLPGGGGRLVPLQGFIKVTYDQPDMIFPDDSSSEPRAVMPCGHVISE